MRVLWRASEVDRALRARWVGMAAEPRGVFDLDWKSAGNRNSSHPMDYLGFGGKLHHHVPSWVSEGACFHIRLRSHAQNNLATNDIAPKLLQSARFYEAKNRWRVTIFLIMPDHLHAILSFAEDHRMSRIVGDWKRYTAKAFGISWQENFFDHRLRGEDQVLAKYHYIRRNPEVSGLCGNTSQWPWWFDCSQS